MPVLDYPKGWLDCDCPDRHYVSHCEYFQPGAVFELGQHEYEPAINVLEIDDSGARLANPKPHISIAELLYKYRLDLGDPLRPCPDTEGEWLLEDQEGSDLLVLVCPLDAVLAASQDPLGEDEAAADHVEDVLQDEAVRVDRGLQAAHSVAETRADRCVLDLVVLQLHQLNRCSSAAA
jgi:hypothetical protein